MQNGTVNLKEQIKAAIFTARPGQTIEEATDNAADDILALIIRSLHLADKTAPAPACPTDALLEELTRNMEDVWVSEFGVELFNLVTLHVYPHKQNVSFSTRREMTMAMIQALLVGQGSL